MENVGMRIKEQMDKLGLTYEKVSEKTGITVSALTSYVEGRIVPKAPVLIRLEKVLDCSASYLLEGEE